MNNADAVDALQGYEDLARRRHAQRFPPAPVVYCGGEPWRPVLTEQEHAEREQYIKDNQLPF